MIPGVGGGAVKKLADKVLQDQIRDAEQAVGLLAGMGQDIGTVVVREPERKNGQLVFKQSVTLPIGGFMVLVKLAVHGLIAQGIR